MSISQRMVAPHAYDIDIKYFCCIMLVICLWLHRSQGFASTSPVSLSDY